jgi:hypothetical protein
MPKTHQPYPQEFRQQILELVRAGRTPDELSQVHPRGISRGRHAGGSIWSTPQGAHDILP